MEQKQRELRKWLCFKEWEQEVIAFVSALVIGLFAHAFIFTNNITLHDNVYNFYMGGTYTSGRWMLAKLLRLSQVAYDTNYLHYTTPLYIGMVALACYGLCAAIMVYGLKIKSRLMSAFIGGIMVVFPSVTALFGFMFTAGMYAFGTLMGVIGALVVSYTGKVKGFWKLVPAIAGIGLQACSVGVYQANIGIMVSFTLLMFLKDLDDKNLQGVLPVLKRIGFVAVESLAYLVTYYGASLYFVKRVGETLSSYQGISDMGNTGVLEYLTRIPLAYKEFLLPTGGISTYMYAGGVRVFYNLFLILILVFTVIHLLTNYKQRIFEGIMYALAILVFPLCVNIIYVMCADNIHSLMVYGEVMIFVLLLYLVSRIGCKGKEVLRAICFLSMAAVVILYARYANVCYLKADYVQKAGISYFDRMIARIESVEGYEAGMPVVFIGERPKVDETVYLYPELDEVKLWPFEIDTMVNNWNWYDFMKSNCGFNPRSGDASLFLDKEEVIAMPNYPAADSIQVLDGSVVVKLGQ